MRPVLVLLSAVLLSAGLLLAPFAPAQTVQRIQPIQTVQPAPAKDASSQLADRTAALEAQNRKLRASNLALKEENAALRARVDAMTTRGGSAVRAYCPTDSTSMNTAGASADCGKSGYNCDPVSGLCRTTCQTSDMCAGGFTCDVGAARCVYTGG
jgi:hypothetical protein